MDPASGREVPRGEAGEICVRGPQVMAGCLNQPEETRRAIDADGHLHTGDMAVQDEDGYLRIVDRTKDMINVSGFRVFSTRVEDVLSTHPAVGSIATIGLPNPQHPGFELVKAFVSLRPDYACQGDAETLKADILNPARSRLAPYEVPREIEIRPELPLTTVGKIDNRRLRGEY